MKGLIFSVKRYSIHDGPGIRVTFFLKGCSLGCWWCHNPEGINPLPERAELKDRVGDKEFIRNEEAGRYYSVDELTDILEKERIFISQSDGGVTFSGGEPLFQAGFLLDALKACKGSGYHTAVDTSGFAPAEYFKAILPFTDLFLFDIKLLDDEKHLHYTGVSNSVILNNFNLLLESGREIIARIPVIPGINDSDESLDAFKSFLISSKRSNLTKVCLLPYHKTGSAKYERFNIANRMNGVTPPSRERMNELKKFFEETGIKVKTGG